MRDGPILLVEDDDTIREVMATVLTAEGYTVQTAPNGADALRTLESAPPSLVVLDMNMPVLNGWGFAAEAKKRGLKAPILVMTAARANAERAATEIGAAGYLAKPFQIIDFLEAVETLRAE